MLVWLLSFISDTDFSLLCLMVLGILLLWSAHFLCRLHGKENTGYVSGRLCPLAFLINSYGATLNNKVTFKNTLIIIHSNYQLHIARVTRNLFLKQFTSVLSILLTALFFVVLSVVNLHLSVCNHTLSGINYAHQMNSLQIV